MTIILIVEDDDAIVEFLTTLLEEEGYQVIAAHNGEEGLAFLEKKRPALVLCDLMMPVLDGEGMCRRMQADPRYQSIPFVLMSAVRSAINRTNCHYTAVLVKPFELNDLLETVDRVISTTSSS